MAKSRSVELKKPSATKTKKPATASSKKKVAVKKAIKKPTPSGSQTVARKKLIKKPAASTKQAATSTKLPVKPAPSDVPKVASKQNSAQHADVALGRPLVTQEEKLYMLFHDDFHSRQVFEFLRVQTVKELEEFSPQQIVHLLSKPIRMTVDRIRERLAKYKRSLREDEAYAAEYQKRLDKK
jgi:hypothetical protein